MNGLPDLPKVSHILYQDDATGNDVAPPTLYYTADQMHQYARDYAAGLSQTAGVAADMALVPREPTDEMVDAGRVAVMALDCCGPKWTVRKHYEASGADPAGIPDELLDAICPMPKADRAELVYCAMLASAPAASGGECHKPCTPIDFFNGDACPDCVTRDYSPQPPTGASVSERARAIDSPIERLRKIRAACGELSAMVGDGPHREHMAIISGQASLAIEQLQREQALTQQLGSPVASICLVTDRRLPHFAAAEIQLYDGYEPKIGDKLYTTPQPGAEALRAVVASLRARADAHELNGLHACSIGLKETADLLDEKAKLLRGVADELESLLARGG